ncbi:hypothetical protein KSP39_PZI010629 [Platanthera zijinensis]|uniref:Uncharacterized protein n=1 Tax=Platanthera zijinensis TaxID=2320716 RepID=A0AAP0BIZ3_9ASPA
MDDLISSLRRIYNIWRARLHSEYYLKWSTDAQRREHCPKDINPEQWSWLIGYWGSAKFNWTDETAEEIYNKLLELHEEQKKEKGEDKLTTKEAYTFVLGKRSGYIRGMGPGPKPLERESTNGRLKAQIRAEVEAEMST